MHWFCVSHYAIDTFPKSSHTYICISRFAVFDTLSPIYLMYGASHSPSEDPSVTHPLWVQVPAATLFRSQVYGSMLAVADSGIGNITAALKASGM